MSKNNTDSGSGKDDLLKIGAVAKSFGVSENNIRRMEAAGLLSPAYVSKDSGYRYYDSDNLLEIATMLSLKSFGFTYEDIREHKKNPGDYTSLYEKLLEKQRAVNLLVEKMGKRLRTAGRQTYDIREVPETCCLIKKVKMVPKLRELSGLLNRFLFDAIRDKYPVDYNKPLMVVTDCMDFLNYSWKEEQELTLCIPLREKMEGENIAMKPYFKAAVFTLNYPFDYVTNMLDAIKELMNTQGVKQSDAMCATFDMGMCLDSRAKDEEIVMHIFVPFK